MFLRAHRLREPGLPMRLGGSLVCVANRRLVRIEVVQQLTRLADVVKGSGDALENDAVRRRRKPAELDLAD